MAKKGGRVGKRAYRKGKKAVAKRTKARAKKSMDTFFLQARTTVGIKPVQGATVANYIYQVWALLDATAPWGCTQIPEFNLYRTLYDKVRINSVTVKWTTKANMLALNDAQNDAALNVTGDGMIHTCIDRDGSAPSQVAQIRKYGSYRGYSVLKGGMRKYNITYPPGVWLDCQAIYSDNTLLQRLGAFGGVTMYAENILEDNLEIFNEPWANVEVFYNCVFQGKNSATVGYDPDAGTVTVTSHTVIPNKLPSDYVMVGIDTIDNSGNLIRGDITQGG